MSPEPSTAPGDVEGVGDRPSPGPMVPTLYRVVGRRRETTDVTTLALTPVDAVTPNFRAGQFNMLTAFGVGEVAISVSAVPGREGPLEHTVRDVGAVTHALCEATVGDLVGVRGPFGTQWGTDTTGPEGSGTTADVQGREQDVVVVAGGIGLAPLRGAIYQLLDRSRAWPSRRIFVMVGAREASQIIFRDDLDTWAGAGARVDVAVDVGSPGWTGHVGVVTSLLDRAEFVGERTTALVCGPEIMMRFTARALIDEGVDPGRIWISLERNMQCAVAWCGHCQLGPLLVCRDGPIVPYAGAVAHLLSERQR